MSKGAEVDSSMSERPQHQRPRRLADWLNPTGRRRVHSLIPPSVLITRRRLRESGMRENRTYRLSGGRRPAPAGRASSDPTPDAWRKRRDRASGNRVGWGRRPAKTVGTGQDGEMSKGAEVDSSMSERPEHQRPRRLADWLNPTGERKVHSLIDKVYKRKNLEMAWGRVKANRGAGGVDGAVHRRLCRGARRAARQVARGPARRRLPTAAGAPEAHPEGGQAGGASRARHSHGLRPGVPAGVAESAGAHLRAAVFDDASFGYRRGRSQHDALRKVWKELESGCEWVVDGDLSDFFGTVDHDKLLTLVAQRVSDGRVLRLIRSMLKAGSYGCWPAADGRPANGRTCPPIRPPKGDPAQRRVNGLSPRRHGRRSQARRPLLPRCRWRSARPGSRTSTPTSAASRAAHAASPPR